MQVWGFLLSLTLFKIITRLTAFRVAPQRVGLLIENYSNYNHNFSKTPSNTRSKLL